LNNIFQKNDLLQLLDILKSTERGHDFVGTKLYGAYNN